MQIKVLDKRTPTIMSDDEYMMIQTMFAQGLSRDQVIKKLNYDKNWYYHRLKKDLALKKAESDGNQQYVENISRDVTSALKKSMLGHTVKTKKVLYDYVTDDQGKSVKIPRGEIVEEKYFPPNSSTLIAVSKKVLKGMTEEDTTDLEVEKRIQALTEGEKLGLIELAEKVFIDNSQ